MCVNELYHYLQEARKPGRQNPTQRRDVFDRMGPRPKVPDHAHIGLSMSANAS